MLGSSFCAHPAAASCTARGSSIRAPAVAASARGRGAEDAAAAVAVLEGVRAGTPAPQAGPGAGLGREEFAEAVGDHRGWVTQVRWQAGGERQGDRLGWGAALQPADGAGGEAVHVAFGEEQAGVGPVEAREDLVCCRHMLWGEGRRRRRRCHCGRLVGWALCRPWSGPGLGRLGGGPGCGGGFGGRLWGWGNLGFVRARRWCGGLGRGRRRIRRFRRGWSPCRGFRGWRLWVQGVGRGRQRRRWSWRPGCLPGLGGRHESRPEAGRRGAGGRAGGRPVGAVVRDGAGDDAARREAFAYAGQVALGLQLAQCAADAVLAVGEAFREGADGHPCPGGERLDVHGEADREERQVAVLGEVVADDREVAVVSHVDVRYA